MLSIIFIILMFVVFGKLFKLALMATWGVTKVIFTLIFLPLILLGLAIGGLIYIAIPVLIVIGIASLVSD